MHGFFTGANGKLLISGDVIAQEIIPADKIKHLCISFDENYQKLLHDSPSSIKIIQCFKYISHKYNYINSLKLTIVNDDFDWIIYMPDMEQPVVSIISNLKCSLDYLYMRFHPWSKDVFEAVDRNGAKLEDINMWLDGDDHVWMDEQCRRLGTSNQAEHIKVLKIRDANTDAEMDNERLRRQVIDISIKLINLVDLRFEGTKFSHTVLFDILQHFPVLETLRFEDFRLEEEDIVNTDIVIEKTKIKELWLGSHSDAWDFHSQQNFIIKTAIDACPLLEKFGCSGEFEGSPGALDLTFSITDI